MHVYVMPAGLMTCVITAALSLVLHFCALKIKTFSKQWQYSVSRSISSERTSRQTRAQVTGRRRVSAYRVTVVTRNSVQSHTCTEIPLPSLIWFSFSPYQLIISRAQRAWCTRCVHKWLPLAVTLPPVPIR